MATLETSNVASRLSAAARLRPDAVAVAQPRKAGPGGARRYDKITFRELQADSDDLARGLVELGVKPGTRLALLVRPGIDFVSLVYALLKSGAVSILIDPGMGRRGLLRCLEEAEPEGFIAVPPVHAVRALLWRRFRRATINVTVGRRWFWGGATLQQVRTIGRETGASLPIIGPDDPAAIIFTTGSTGPPKGVLYKHGNFDTQVSEIRDHYGIEPGDVDLACFPLFGLFNAAMGVTSVIPDMDPSRPAKVNPKRILEAAADWKVTQAFGSPAVWNRVGRYCVERELNLPTLRRVLSAGAPVPAQVIARMKACIHPDGEMFTPYGATEALPVASTSATEVLTDTSLRTQQGAGVCVGRPFPLIEWKVIRIESGQRAEGGGQRAEGSGEGVVTIDDVEEMPCGEIGELIVRGPAVTQQYATRREWNLWAKIADGDLSWHRMGDSGYLDERGRFWFCGRVAHRVLTSEGPLYPICCEAIFNRHESVYRSALVGVGPAGHQRPVIVAEPHKFPRRRQAARLLEELDALARQHKLTHGIRHFLLHRSLPVDIRHNSKIFREKLAVWAARLVKVEP